MTNKQRTILQDTFLAQCRASTQTLDEILEEIDVPPETLAGWLTDDAFRRRLHAMRQELRRKRELQVQIGAARAAAELTRTVDGTDPRASAVRRLPEQIPHPRSFRREDQPAAVGRPHLDNINTGRGCETSERRAAKIPEPEITLLIVDEDRHARAIG